ncbi:hypothetical protein Ahy_B05g074274 [Arachis hypogaea]|uniref:Uncharacterized protein n=1 Tax=Arachis hypogaea TaxID=3818 RepID=A0A444YYD5_ARAHY|nr:hypothetical protein Ahy_B05g074274 [Arachis hypogaea]
MQETEDLEELPASSIQNGKRDETREEKTEDITIPELARTHPALMTFKSVQLSPATWMAVSWKNRGTFYTNENYDTRHDVYCVHALFWIKNCETESDNIDTEKDIYWWCGWGSTEGNKCKNKNGSSGGGSISVPPFGLATYKMQEDLWLNPEPCEYERISYLYSAADSWLKQLNVYHHDFNFFTQHPTPTTL